MSPLIARRYRPQPAVRHPATVGETLLVEDTLQAPSSALVALRVIAGSEESALQVRLTLRAGALERLKHPVLQPLYDHGTTAEGQLFVVGAAPVGRPLADLIPLPPDRVPLVFWRLCQGLRALHARGLAHGELSLDRIAIADDFQPRLDHGLRLGLDAQPADDMRQLGRLLYEVLVGQAPAAEGVLPGDQRTNVPGYQDAWVQRLMAGELPSIDDALLLLPVPAAAGAGLSAASAPLLGRDAELARLHRAWEDVAARQSGALVGLTGAAGAGKTRLVDEATIGWQLAGASVIVGRAVAGAAPYRPWVDVLRRALPWLHEVDAPAYALAAPVLQSLVGDLGVTGAPTLEPRQEKLRLQGAIADVLGTIARRGLVLLLENWAHADPLSREVLSFVARQAAESPLLLVVVGHDGLVGAELPQEALELAPLPAETQSALARELLGARPVEASAMATLLAFSAGNPRLLGELVGYLLEARQLQLVHGTWLLERPLEAAPGAIDDLYRARLAHLSAPAREAASWAAVAGSEGEIAVLQAVWPGEPGLLRAGLQEIVEQGILATGSLYYRFLQPGWLAATLEGLSPAELARRHDAIATHLEALAAAGSAPQDWLQRRATHALAGSDGDRAIRAAIEAGQANLALFASAEARRFLEAGLARWEQAGGQQSELAALELPFRRMLADVKRFGGEYDESVALYERAAELAAAAGDAEAHGFILTSAGKCRQMRNQYAEARDYYHRALAVYADCDDPRGKLRALTSLARTAFIEGQMAEAESLYQQALADAETAGERVAIGESLGALGLLIVSNHPARIQEGIGFLQRSVTLRQEMGDRIGLIDSYSLLGNAQLALGQLPAAREAFTRTQRLCFETGITDEEIFALINLGIVAGEMGDFRRAFELASAAKTRAVASGSRFCESLALAIEGLALAYLGELEHVQARMDAAIGLARELGNKYLEVNILVFLTETHLIFGRLTDSVGVANACEQLMAEIGYVEFEARLLVFRGEVHGRLGERDEARQLLVRALETARATQNAAAHARVLRTLAWLNLQERNWLEARDYARQALDAARAIGAAYLEGEAHWLLGEVDLAAGQVPAATRELQAAMALGERTDSPHLQCLALFCLARAADEDLHTREYLFQARDLLKAQLAQLDELTREDYLALAERWRVDRGELVFAEKARKKKGLSELTPEGRLYFERLTQFAAFTAALHQPTGVPGCFEGALPHLLALLETQRICLLVEGGDRERVAYHAAADGAGPVAADRQVLETLWGSRETFYQPYAAEDPRFAGWYPDTTAALLAVPFGHGIVLALRSGMPFTSEEIHLVELVAQQCGLAAGRARAPQLPG